MKLFHSFLNNSSTTTFVLTEDDKRKSLPFSRKIGPSVDASLSEVKDDWEVDTKIDENDHKFVDEMDLWWVEKYARNQFWPYISQASYYLITPVLEAFGIGFESTEITINDVSCGMPYIHGKLCVQETENGNDEGPTPNGKYEVNDILTYVIFLKNTGYEDAVYNKVSVKLNNYLHYIEGSMKGPAGTIMSWDSNQRLLSWTNFPVKSFGRSAVVSFRTRIDDNSGRLILIMDALPARYGAPKVMVTVAPEGSSLLK